MTNLALRRPHWTLVVFPIGAVVIGMMASMMYGSFTDRNWRNLQQRIVQIELGLVCSIAKDAYVTSKADGVSNPDSTTMASKRDQFEQAAKRIGLGEVQLAIGKSTVSPLGGTSFAPTFDWYWEPDGYRRVQVTQFLTEDAAPFQRAFLSRRFSPQETPQSIWNWVFPWIGLLIGTVIGVRAYHNSKSRELCIHSLQSSRLNSNEFSKNVQTLVNYQNGWLSRSVFREFVATLEVFASETITTKKNAEQSEQVLSAMPVGILAFGPDLRLAFVNRAGNDLLELGNRYRSGMRLVELIRQPKVIELLMDSQKSKQTLDGELEGTAGKTILRLRAYPLPVEAFDAQDPQQRVAMLLIVSDETRLRQLENSRRDFTANVSHELKTPLSAIKAYSETLLMGALDDPDANRRFVERIGEQATRLDQLIRDLLQLTRIQSQPEKIELTSISVLEIVRTCVEEHQTIGKTKQIDVASHIQDSSLRVRAEYEALRTILGNLLSNAVRYSEPGDRVVVEATSDSDTVSIHVIDWGIGIPIEDIDRIFERFYRVDKARSQDAGGTGLGLAIVKHLAHALGGQVSVKSEKGKGSVFTLQLKKAASI